jgi:TorA maturation chaperone TorD
MSLMTQDASGHQSLDDTDALRVEVYRLLAGLLRDPPAPALLDWLAGLDIQQDGSLLAQRWAALAASAADADPEALRRAHFRHLIGVIQGDVLPYASWYRQGELMDAALVELRHDLKALGFRRTDHTRDPEDHLAALCEVMAMLIEGHSDQEARFFMAHLAPWAEHCLADLGRVATDFYAVLGRLGEAFIQAERMRLEAEASREPVRILTP